LKTVPEKSRIGFPCNAKVYLQNFIGSRFSSKFFAMEKSRAGVPEFRDLSRAIIAYVPLKSV
jgi:hypothetical protein